MHLTSEVFFKIKLIYFWILDPVIIFFIIEITNFRGDLSNISAKTATLHLTVQLLEVLAELCDSVVTSELNAHALEHAHVRCKAGQALLTRTPHPN